MRPVIEQYCAAIGKDPLLVQGAGGNVSWKEGNTLWIKASGTCLADALHRDIFIPVDLGHLQGAIKTANFAVTPRLSQESSLRPSIETHFHALMPHPIVVHLHAIDILSYLVRSDAQSNLQSLLPSYISWVMVGYHKPGVELAKAVNHALIEAPQANVIFLQNHGVIIGGTDLHEIDAILRTLIENLPTISCAPIDAAAPLFPFEISQDVSYTPLSDHAVHQLAINPELFNRLKKDWALYPDHVVFLGDRPVTYGHVDLFKQDLVLSKPTPEMVFIEHVGVFTLPSFSIAKQEQLRCYYDVLSRQVSSHLLHTLNCNQVADLLNWDAEQYRMNAATLKNSELV